MVGGGEGGMVVVGKQVLISKHNLVEHGSRVQLFLRSPNMGLGFRYFSEHINRQDPDSSGPCLIHSKHLSTTKK